MSIKIIHFSSPLCSICTSQEQILSDLATTHGINYTLKLITSDLPLALQYGVKSAPSLVYLSGQKALAVKPGLQSKSNILAVLQSLNSG